VREESHLEEMRSAIRGDFERLAERRGDQELMRVADPEPAQGEGAPTEPEEPVLEVESQPEPEPDDEQRRSWLARLFAP
jgi:hypothetical protein